MKLVFSFLASTFLVVRKRINKMQFNYICKWETMIRIVYMMDNKKQVEQNVYFLLEKMQ
jgi:hypothetical protein